jgi:DNA-directed RNA polymerase subunit N (RpoN/RPB10)
MAELMICKNCGSTISHKYILFHKKKKNGSSDNSSIFKELNITRICCKTFITSSNPDENYRYIK